MGDPLSVAGSVAGLISLGIQVTQSLVDFYALYRDRDSNLASTTKELESLLDIFQHLETALASRKFQADERALIERIEKTIRESDECIKELQDECQKFRKDSTHGAKDAFKVAARRLAYPFRRSTLQKLEEVIGELRVNVSTALAVLQLKDQARVQQDIDDTKGVIALVRASQISADIRDWLKAPDASINHNGACAKRHPGTGMWLIESDTYIRWLGERNSLLWISGFAGSGKSVLCSTAIQHVFRHRRSEPRIGIAFFYFTFNDESKQDELAMLRAWLLQLSSQLEDGYKDLTKLYESNRPSTPPSSELLDCLLRLVQRFDHVYLMLDALDESPRNKQREKVFDTLQVIRGWNSEGVHLFTTSRDELDIRDFIKPFSNQEVKMRNAGIETDIADYVSGQLTADRRLAKWLPYREKIQETLVKGAQGVFRWVECQFESLKSCPRSEHHLNHILKSLPQSLDETYERILCNIDNYSIEEARRILTLLCFSSRPLEVNELIDGIAVEITTIGGLKRERRLHDANDILAICPGLVDISCNDLFVPEDSAQFSGVGSNADLTSTVRIAHFSVQEYLESERIRHQRAAIFSMSSATAHAEISQICLLYLVEPAISSPQLFDIVLNEYPLARFAAMYWYHHYQQAGCPSTLHDSIFELFLRQDSFISWVTLYDMDPYKYRTTYDRAPKHTASPVYYASLLGLEEILHRLTDAEEQKNKPVSSTPIPCPSEKIEMLNVREGFYGNPLQAASYAGHKSVVQLLLQKGANVNAQGGEYGNALQAASYKGNESLVQLLLQKGADVNAQGGRYGSALQAASYRGHESVVQLLLKNGADVNAQGGEYGNALQAASYGGHESVVQLLLKNGADVNAQGGVYGNALQAASYGGHKSVVQLLHKNGADVNAQGGEYGNALLAASYKGNESLVQLLLKNGADVNAQGDEYGNALQASSFEGHESVVQLLLQNGADVNAQGGRYGNALQAASLSGHESVVQLLLKNGADVNAQGGRYGHALQAASLSGHESVVQLLLAEGALAAESTSEEEESVT